MTGSGTRLFLVAPAGMEPGVAAACVEAACRAGDVACLLLRAGEDGAHHAGPAARLIGAGQAHGAAVVLEDDADLAQALGADGAHVTAGAEAAQAARRLLGADAIVGGECRGRRHEAMTLGAAGIDYLALDQRLEAGGENMLAWWAELFVVPVVAIHPAPPSAAAELAARGADFICPDARMWESAEAAARIVAETMKALGGLAAGAKGESA